MFVPFVALVAFAPRYSAGTVSSLTADVKKYQPAKGLRVSMVFPAVSVSDGERDTVTVLFEGIYVVGEVDKGVRVRVVLVVVLVDERLKYDDAVPDEKRVVVTGFVAPVATEVTTIFPFWLKRAVFMAFVKVTVIG
jgi:hypothetical protein